jgi:signal peptidase II
MTGSSAEGAPVEPVPAPAPRLGLRDPAMLRKVARLYAVALALVLVDQGVKYDVVDKLTTRFEGLGTVGERLAALYGTPPPQGYDGLHFRPRHAPRGDPNDPPGGVVLSECCLMIRYTENPGAAFGLFRRFPASARGPLFHLVSIGAVVLITTYFLRLTGSRQERWARIGLPLVLGGALGNWVDRLARGFVIDFIEAHWREVYSWPSFNVADSAIVVGVALLVIDGFVRKERKPAA